MNQIFFQSLLTKIFVKFFQSRFVGMARRYVNYLKGAVNIFVSIILVIGKESKLNKKLPVGRITHLKTILRLRKERVTELVLEQVSFKFAEGLVEKEEELYKRFFENTRGKEVKEQQQEQKQKMQSKSQLLEPPPPPIAIHAVRSCSPDVEQLTPRSKEKVKTMVSKLTVEKDALSPAASMSDKMAALLTNKVPNSQMKRGMKYIGLNSHASTPALKSRAKVISGRKTDVDTSTSSNSTKFSGDIMDVLYGYHPARKIDLTTATTTKNNEYPVDRFNETASVLRFIFSSATLLCKERNFLETSIAQEAKESTTTPTTVEGTIVKPKSCYQYCYVEVSTPLYYDFRNYC